VQYVTRSKGQTIELFHMPVQSVKDETDFTIRLATPDDIPQLHSLIELSIRQLSIGYYTQAEIDGSVGYIFGPDTLLIADGTYFVVEHNAQPSLIIASGGWSFRKTVYGSDRAPNRFPGRLNPAVDAAKIRAIFVHPSWKRRGLGTLVIRHCEQAARDAGFKRFEMGSTMTGLPLYLTLGYERVHDEVVPLPNGAHLTVVKMTKKD
jgi:GNAT superfamily N-acetyltransferase